ncbi:MAG TPA: LuxR C-terminal-related transcriptional regulator [Patescibacteria group bacterium]|nr:LuxR C-terminal-related transcriptional regulator [Gammaproteobacteria bacterium]HWA52495.1 LuxR C-terminal-related transcriptional regulator [Patescibacteria group bacterium]
MKKDVINKKSSIVEQEQKNEFNFTELEIEYVLKIMQNKSLSNIAVDLGISPNTIRFYIKSCAQKLFLICNTQE